VLHAVHGVALARRVRRLPLHVRLGFRPAAVSASQPAQPEPPAGAPLPPTPSPQWLVHILQPLGWWAASSVALAVLLNQPAFRIWWLATSAEWLQWNVVVPITVPLVVGLVLRVWSYGDSFASIKAEAAEREQRSKADWASFKADVLAAMASSKADAAEREQRSKADAAERELRTKSDSRERERRVVEWTKVAASANTAAAAQVVQSAAQASAAAAQAIAAAAQASAASTPSPSAEVSW
jgi:ABC-type multidrug transport system fused ATPase/permease subunit